jgi:hypothetical protein
MTARWIGSDRAGKVRLSAAGDGAENDSDLACALTLRQPLVAIGVPVQAYA